MVSTDKYPLSTLSLNSLRLQVRLGCEPRERLSPQPVRFDVCFRFPSIPQGCYSDHLNDTVCYDQAASVIRKVSEKREFLLIESLCWDVYSALREISPKNVKIRLRVTKEFPPIPDLSEGATFCLGDWEENPCSSSA